MTSCDPGSGILEAVDSTDFCSLCTLFFTQLSWGMLWWQRWLAMFALCPLLYSEMRHYQTSELSLSLTGQSALCGGKKTAHSTLNISLTLRTQPGVVFCIQHIHQLTLVPPWLRWSTASFLLFSDGELKELSTSLSACSRQVNARWSSSLRACTTSTVRSFLTSKEVYCNFQWT